MKIGNLIAILIGLIVIAAFVAGCDRSPASPSPTAVAVPASSAAAPSKGLELVTVAVYAAPDAGTCKQIRGYLCKAVVKIITDAGDVAALTGGPQGKVTLSVDAGTWPILARYNKSTDAAATASWCYDGVITVPANNWTVLRAARC